MDASVSSLITLSGWTSALNKQHKIQNIGSLSMPSFFSSLSLSFSHSVVFDSLQPHGLQNARLSCPSLSLGVCSNSCSLSQWCQPTISSSIIPFSSCPQSFPASESFPMSWLFASGGQIIGTSALASVFPTNIQGWFPLGLTSLISLLSKGTFKSLLQHHSSLPYTQPPKPDHFSFQWLLS